MNKALETFEKYIIFTTVFLTPLVVLPFFSNPFGLSKNLVLIAGISLALLIKAIRTITKGSFELSFANFDFPLLLLALAYLLSSILRTPNKMEAFFLPGTTSLILASTLLYFLINQVKEKKQELETYIFASGVVFSLAILLATSGVLAKIPQLPEYIKAESFNPEGSPLPGAIFLGVILPLGLGLLLKFKSSLAKTLVGASLLISIFALVISINNSLPGKKTEVKLLDYASSWSIFIDSIKGSPILGVGSANYLTAFNVYRPITLNTTDLWVYKFMVARNQYLTAITETGLLGLTALAILLVLVYKNANEPIKKLFRGEENFESTTGIFSLVLILLAFAVFPATAGLWVLAFALLALNSKERHVSLNLTMQSQNPATFAQYSSKFPAIILALPIIAGVIVLGFYSIKYVRAETKFNTAMNALAKNDGRKSYDSLREAITLNPYVDRYQASFSRINLGLARATAQKPNLTTQDKNTVAQLIQQSIATAKSTVTLNQDRAANWQLMAEVYRAIIPFAQGADTFAVQTYNQAVNLDPINPELRISQGGVYYALGRYDEAIKAFELATLAKPDLANAHFNLAAAYREKGEIEKAKTQMTLVLSLVKKDSADYDLAKTELNNLEKRAPKNEVKTSENLTPPSPAEKAVIKPPLQLPQEATPPATVQ